MTMSPRRRVLGARPAAARPGQVSWHTRPVGSTDDLVFSRRYFRCTRIGTGPRRRQNTACRGTERRIPAFIDLTVWAADPGWTVRVSNDARLDIIGRGCVQP